MQGLFMRGKEHHLDIKKLSFAGLIITSADECNAICYRNHRCLSEYSKHLYSPGHGNVYFFPRVDKFNIDIIDNDLYCSHFFKCCTRVDQDFQKPPPSGTIEENQVPRNISSEFRSKSTYCALL